jgi:hypothetical protein
MDYTNIIADYSNKPLSLPQISQITRIKEEIISPFHRFNPSNSGVPLA